VILTEVPTLTEFVLSEMLEPDIVALDVVADAVFDGKLVPTEFIADTL